MNSLLIVAALTLSSSLLISESVASSGGYYERINDHLVKEVQSEEPEANMAELRSWLGAKRTLLTKNSGVWPVIEDFIRMEDLFEHYTKCNFEDVKILSSSAEGLIKALNRRKEENYPLLRVERMVQYYFNKYGLLCADNVSGFNVPQESHLGWKRSAYLALNTHVLNQDDHPSTASVMRLVKDHLKELEKEQMEGSVTDAARQFVAMETRVLGVEKCTYKAYEIIRANELAVAEYHVLPRWPRQMQSAFKEMVEQHASLCKGTYQERFQSKLRQLDAKTFRSIAILASEFFLQHIYHSDHRALVADIDHKQYQQINPDMSTPQVVELMTKLAATEQYEPDVDQWESKNKLWADELFPQNLEVFETETGNDMSKNFDGLKSLFEEFVMKPCQKYKDLMEELLLPSLYHSYQTLSILPVASRDQLLDHLSLRLGQAAYQLCSKAVKIEDNFIDEFVGQALEIANHRM